jgi:hypothetical protein
MYCCKYTMLAAMRGTSSLFHHAANIWDKAKQCSLAYRVYNWHWHCVGRTGGYQCSTRSWSDWVYWMWSEMTSQKCPVWVNRVMCACTVTAHISMVQSHCMVWTSWTKKVKSWWQGCHHRTVCWHMCWQLILSWGQGKLLQDILHRIHRCNTVAGHILRHFCLMLQIHSSERQETTPQPRWITSSIRTKIPKH